MLTEGRHAVAVSCDWLVLLSATSSWLSRGAACHSVSSCVGLRPWHTPRFPSSRPSVGTWGCHYPSGTLFWGLWGSPPAHEVCAEGFSCAQSLAHPGWALGLDREVGSSQMCLTCPSAGVPCPGSDSMHAPLSAPVCVSWVLPAPRLCPSPAEGGAACRPAAKAASRRDLLAVRTDARCSVFSMSQKKVSSSMSLHCMFLGDFGTELGRTSVA